MCDKMAISTYIMKIAENDPFLRLSNESYRNYLIVPNLFSSNKQYVEIELMQMRQIGGVFFSKGEILIEMIKNVKIVIIKAFKSKFYQYFVFTKKILHRFVLFCISLVFTYYLCVGKELVTIKHFLSTHLKP